jgi:hypothetical protein
MDKTPIRDFMTPDLAAFPVEDAWSNNAYSVSPAMPVADARRPASRSPRQKAAR